MKSRIELNQEKQDEILKEQKKESQKKIVKRIVKLLLFLFVFVFFFCLYVVKIGTVSLIVKEETLSFSNLPKSFDGLKIIHFSDLHYDNIALLKDVVTTINRRNPDLLFFTGDLVDDNLSVEERQNLVTELKKLNASLGKYAVLGEEDEEVAKTILIDCGFTILENQYDLIYQHSLFPILVIGLNTNQEDIDYDQAFSYYQLEGHDETIFSILLFHKPDVIDEALTHHSVNLALAGHSHLGQIRFPLLPALIKKDHVGKYQEDYYEMDMTKFYISSGIGTSDYPYRFLVRPSITFFRLTSTAS